ncbi:MAG: PSD1 and planctomycete cytochrome C domain-containing protein [Vicinamibacterales bacterium]|nr:PSD1 and planctomycete cytochrome C domain-containing protein [Vicinamibacterales bacterium]
MRRIVLSVFVAAAAVVSLVALLGAQAPSPAAPPAQVTFAKDVQPILEKSCFSCHSADLKLGELDLSTRDAAVAGGAHGAALVPGSADRSKLYRMAAGLDQPKMPMQGDALKPAELAVLKSWIDQGAIWETSVSFAKDIQPILASSCLNCHGDALQLSKFDLRTRESALLGGQHGSDIVPGNAEQSRMYKRVAGLEKPSMPQQGTPLTAEQVAKVKQWINDGAKWDAPAMSSAAPSPASSASANAAVAALMERPITEQERNYWAFKLPVQAPPPVVANKNLVNPVDRFLEKARVDRGLKAAPRADKNTLVRRAYLDLLGLPPTPAQVEEFVSDSRPDAWESLIDTLLASPHYGERYGRHWLDVARYADSGGFEYDIHRPNAWRYRDYVIKSFNQDKAYTQFITEQLAGDEMDYKTQDSLIATGFLRMGPRVLFREKDNPERRYDYLDEILGTIGKGMLGLTVNCARCHNHKFDPIMAKDYYAMEAAIFGYVETEYPLAPPAEAEAYLAKNEEITNKVEALRLEIEKIEKPYRDKLNLEQVKQKYPEHIYAAAAKPESERTPGEQLLATQVLTGVRASVVEVEALMTPAELARKKELRAEQTAVLRQRPKPLPMAEIVTDGDHRFQPLALGDNTISCPKCRIPPAEGGSFIHKGPAPYKVPASYFLIRGDVESKGPQMKPGFIGVITNGNPPTEIPRPDGHTSGRRLALAQWIASPQNPMTARVWVNRVWQKHFGKGIVSTLENFGKMGAAPTNPELLDWLAVEFMNRGWSTKQINKLMMMSEAYQMASVFNDETNTKNDLENNYLWRYRPQRLDAEIVRDSMLAVGGNINLTVGGEPIFPNIPEDILQGQYRGKWDNTPEGPAAWRRGVYVYRRRSLPYPMFDTFDHPDLNAMVGARNVSTVPTQALTLLNNPFVLSEARWLAERVGREAADPYTQVELAYRIALSRAATETEISIGMDLIKKRSLESFTHVVLNLDEFLYMR